MSDSSPRLGLPYLMPAQAQKHVTHNEALQRLDILVQLRVQAFGATEPPALPVEGEVHALGTGATGAWADQDGRIAGFVNGAWLFLEPQDGMLAVSAVDGTLKMWRNGGWTEPPLPEITDRLGINATPDAANRLSLSAPATLLNHEGAGHQVKVNKNAVSDTASLLFQTGFSGRAEMGTAGSDDWVIKVSPDGSAWTEALRIDAATGHATGAAVQSGPSDAAAGRLLTAGAAATVLSASPALCVPSGGSANAITLSTGAGLTPVAGLELRFRAVATNTGIATIALDGGTPRPCRTVSGAVLPASYIRTDQDTRATYDGTHWQLDRQPESGGDASGAFWRYADGRLDCNGRINLGPANANGAGTYASPYYTNNVSTIFAACFSAVPVVNLQQDPSGLFNTYERILLIAPYSVTTTGLGSIRAANLAGAASNEDVIATYNATGRWY